MTKVFVSYHHENDQHYREHLAELGHAYDSFQDGSVEVGDIGDDLPSETIRRIIRDDYLRDTEVTVLLCGTETRFRKHIDWELKSSMIDGRVNRKSGILIIDLPTTSSTSWHCGLPDEKSVIYSDYAGSWMSLSQKSDYRSRYPDMPERVIDNLIAPRVSMSVVPWARIENQPDNLRWLVDATATAGRNNQYDLTLPMRRKNYNPKLENGTI
jgi:hypothetical protein